MGSVGIQIQTAGIPILVFTPYPRPYKPVSSLLQNQLNFDPIYAHPIPQAEEDMKKTFEYKVIDLASAIICIVRFPSHLMQTYFTLRSQVKKFGVLAKSFVTQVQRLTTC